MGNLTVDPYSAIHDDHTYILRTLDMQVLVSWKWSPSHVAILPPPAFSASLLLQLCPKHQDVDEGFSDV